jgi:aerobic-type carbon monoxide dehydrogenase small subunit (CoxS/CutS family)
MPTYSLHVNGERHQIEAPEDMPLLWAIRDILGLVGTKFGCGENQCGACTVHADGDPIRSCSVKIARVGDAKITTIEGLSPNGLNAVQRAWISEDVPQCGYCQSGQIMAASALLAENADPTDAEIDRAMSRNICRCGTYQRIKAAIHTAAREG